VIRALVESYLHDPMWPVLAADLLFTFGVALAVISYTAWSGTRD